MSPPLFTSATTRSALCLGWLSLRTMEDEINHILSRSESKSCMPNGSTCTSKTIGLLVRRHIVAGEFHYIGKEASTRWAGGVDLSMLAEAGALDPVDETFREYERVVDPKYLEEIRARAKQFSTKLLSRQSRVSGQHVNLLPKDRIGHCHCKDAVKSAKSYAWALMGGGIIDWAGQFRSLKCDGYHYAVSLARHCVRQRFAVCNWQSGTAKSCTSRERCGAIS
jgi:hypothetical protein